MTRIVRIASLAVALSALPALSACGSSAARAEAGPATAPLAQPPQAGSARIRTRTLQRRLDGQRARNHHNARRPHRLAGLGG